MKLNEALATVLMVLSTVGVVAVIFGAEKYRRSTSYTYDLIARTPDHGNWYPRELQVRRGQKVRLLIRNIETVTHGFAIPDLNIAVREIKAGHVSVVEFTPEKSGTFPFLCTVWCSDRHMEMTGTLVVK